MLTQRKEIDRTFAEAAGSGETLSVDQLVRFLQHQQREEAAGPALALSLIERYEPSEKGEGLARAHHLQFRGHTGLGDSWGGLQPERRELQDRGAPASLRAWGSMCVSHESRQVGGRAPVPLPPSVPPSRGFEDPPAGKRDGSLERQTVSLLPPRCPSRAQL